jgi:hypothetical protein
MPCRRLHEAEVFANRFRLRLLKGLVWPLPLFLGLVSSGSCLAHPLLFTVCHQTLSEAVSKEFRNSNVITVVLGRSFRRVQLLVSAGSNVR